MESNWSALTSFTLAALEKICIHLKLPFPPSMQEINSLNYGSGVEDLHAILHTVNVMDQLNEMLYNGIIVSGQVIFILCARDLSLARFILNFHLSALGLLIRKKP